MEYSLPLRPGRFRRARDCKFPQRRSTRRSALASEQALDALRVRARAHRRLSRTQTPKDEMFTDALGVETRLALARDRIGRALRAGRRGELSLLRADERRAGAKSPAARASPWSCRRPRAELNPLVLAAARDRRRRRNLSRRRRAGDRGAGLRNRDDRAGREDRRSRQRLCRRRQAARVRRRRHRHDRRAVRSRRARGRDRRSPLCRRRSARSGRARRGGAIDSHHRRRALARAVEREVAKAA